ncbi:MAG: DUF4190 domain-containing protein [Planctomycetota bacterium]
MTQATPPVTPSESYMRPHRGAMVLVLGILGIVINCFVLGIIAWVMGNNDLSAMRAGTMDPTGEGLTQAGRICGIISVALGVLGLCIGIVWMIIVLMALGAAGAAGAGGA